jgi:hypothetical protein
LPLYGFAPSRQLEHLQHLTYNSSPNKIVLLVTNSASLNIMGDAPAWPYVYSTTNCKFSYTQPEFRNLVAFGKKN